jgi:hypothetical protein
MMIFEHSPRSGAASSYLPGFCQCLVRSKIAKNARAMKASISPAIRRAVTNRNRVKPVARPKLIVAKNVKVVKRDPAIDAKTRRRNRSCFLTMLPKTSNRESPKVFDL